MTWPPDLGDHLIEWQGETWCSPTNPAWNLLAENGAPRYREPGNASIVTHFPVWALLVAGVWRDTSYEATPYLATMIDEGKRLPLATRQAMTAALLLAPDVATGLAIVAPVLFPGRVLP